MTEEELSRLSVDDKLKVTQFLIADLTEQLLSQDPQAADHARHEVGAMAIVYNNILQLFTSDKPDRERLLRSIHDRYRYQPSATLSS